MTEYSDVPAAVVDRLRACCTALPEVEEQQPWTGCRWAIRKRTFAHVLAVEGPAGPSTILVFRSAGEELGVLRHAGHPFFSPGWGANTVGMVLDDASDWDEVVELVTESYCVQAPKRLVALVARPPEG